MKRIDLLDVWIVIALAVLIGIYTFLPASVQFLVRYLACVLLFIIAVCIGLPTLMQHREQRHQYW